MSRSKNLIILVGHLGRDPEIRAVGNTKVCKLALATSESWKDKKTGEWKEETDWHQIELWGGSAEWAGKNLRKGSYVCVEGSYKNNNYEKDGVKHYGSKVKAFKVDDLSPKSEVQNQQRDNQRAADAAYERQQQSQPQVGGDFEDELPF